MKVYKFLLTSDDSGFFDPIYVVAENLGQATRECESKIDKKYDNWDYPKPEIENVRMGRIVFDNN